MIPADALTRLMTAQNVIRATVEDMDRLGRALQVAQHCNVADEVREVMARLNGAEHSVSAAIHLVEIETN